MKVVVRQTMLLLAGSLMWTGGFAQETPSIHQREWEYYRDHPELVGRPALPPLRKRADLETVSLTGVVYGFHPYWQNGSESNYYFSLLTHLAYFSGDIDPATGGFSSTHSWSSANVVTLAKSYGIKVHFAVTLFSGHSTLLNSSTNRQNLINNIITQINLRGADGCNVDFEAMSASVADSFKTFIYELGTALKAAGKELVVELFAWDWNSIFPASFFTLCNPVVDFYFLMAYDYYYSGSSTSGPVAPLRSSSITSTLHVLRSVNAYLAIGCPANKMIAGFPYYGIDWPTQTNALMSTATGTGSARTYTIVKNSYIDTIPPGQQYWNATYNTSWYYYTSGSSWRQCWYDDSTSLGLKYDSIKVKNLAGTGMWALGYDGTETELWGALKTAFASSPNPSHTSLADFETSVGVFDKAPTYSGSTYGILTTSTSAQTVGVANNGVGALQVVLQDSTTSSSGWRVRLLSGTGSPGNNQTLNVSGYVGFWLKTSTAPSAAEVALTIDDGAGGTELSSKLSVLNDGNWHLYEWNLVGGGWTSFAGGNGTMNGPTATLDAIMLYAPDNGGEWTLFIDDASYNSAGSLPVQLASFSANVKKKDVELRWVTASETNNYGFQLEKRQIYNTQDWEIVGFVAGAGNSSSPRNYFFVDLNISPGRYAYRLRQINQDGSFAYSRETEIQVPDIPLTFTLFQNYPNPFNPSTTIEFTLAEDGSATLKVSNILGQEVATLFDGQSHAGRIQQVKFDASRLPSGLYFAKLEAGKQQVISKMMLLK